jgi:hypothetical protein
VPSVGIVTIYGNNGTALLMKRAVSPRDIDGELINPVAAVTLDMDFKYLDRVSARA